MSQWAECQLGEGLDGAKAEHFSSRQNYCSSPNCSSLRNILI